MNTRNYLKSTDYTPLTLEALYSGNTDAIQILDEDLENIISTEAPITLNILKERLREVFGVAKISGKALTIIEEEINKLGFVVTDNLYDKVYWPQDGIFNVEYLRVGYPRQIYDIPNQELRLLSLDLAKEGYFGEAHHRKVLEYFGYEVLTEKARVYLDYIEEVRI